MGKSGSFVFNEFWFSSPASTTVHVLKESLGVSKYLHALEGSSMRFTHNSRAVTYAAGHGKAQRVSLV